MSLNLPRQLAGLYSSLVNCATPRRRDEALKSMDKALRLAFGEVRLLFYLAGLPPDLEPLSLVPCPARQLNADVFVYDAASQVHCFTFETRQPHYAPIALDSRSFGLLFLERVGHPLDELEKHLVALCATQAARHLEQLCRMDPSGGKGADGSAQLIISQTCRQVWIKGVALPLSDRQLAALQLLYRHRGHTCSRDLICQTVYANEVTIANCRESRLDQLILKLRKKLSQIAHNPVIIETVWGEGYRLKVRERER